MALYYRKACSIKLGDVVFIGTPVMRGNICIASGVLVSLYDGNPLGVVTKSRLIAETGSIHIGHNFAASGVTIYSSSKVSIGDNVMIGIGCIILDDDMHSTDYLVRQSNKGHSKKKPIVIEDDVWLCANVIILKGVTIGARSVIGAGVVVSRDIPPDSVVSAPLPYIRSVSSRIV